MATASAASAPPALEGVTVQDLDGAPVQLSSLWEDRPVVLAFVRHFGCLFCREQAVALRDEVPKIHEAGAELVIIGCGSPTQARWFAEDTEIKTPLFTDPTTKAYWAAGMKRGIARTINLKALGHAFRAFRAGHRQTKTKGAPFQQGGVLVVAKGGAIQYSFASNDAGDHAPLAEVMSALARV
jgi:peroxiredoxin